MMRVTAEALAPLALGSDPQAGNVTDTYGHVPGSVLRGALASAWIREHGLPSELSGPELAEFVELFEGPIRYGALIAEGASVVPLSVWRCRYQVEPGCEAVAIDEADDGGPLDGDQPRLVCPVCGDAVRRGKGETVRARRWRDDGTPEPALVEVTRTRLTEAETASEGNLFTRRAIPRGVTLQGRIWGSHPWLDALDTDAVWLGGRRSTGGRARVRTTPGGGDAVADRQDGTILIRLTGPGVFVDAATRPLADFPYDEIASVLGCPVRLERRWLRIGRVGGWHAASGLPKPQDVVLVPGSAVLLRPAEPAAPTRLTALQVRGLGLRRPEGFGEIAVNPAPWGAPADDAEPPASNSDRAAVVDALRMAAADPDRARWLADQLRQRAAAAESGTAPPVDEAVATRRLRDQPQSIRDAVRAVLDSSDPSHLRDLLALLEDPGATT